MKRRLVLSLRYALQVISLVVFVFLFMKLVYPAGTQAVILKWFSRLDPWGVISHIRWQHSFPVWGWLPLLVILITLIFGRVFCGWFCPFGALLMVIDKISRLFIRNKSFKKISSFRTKALHKLQPFRYYWLLFLAITLLLGFNWAYSLTPFALFSHEIAGIFRDTVPWVLILLIVITIFFSRLWCSVLCPTGILLSLFSRLRLFRYQVSGDCVHCAKCAQSCSVDAAMDDTGIVKEGCLVCGECKNICPTKTIQFLPLSYQRKNKDNISETAVTTSDHMHTRRQFFEIAGTSMLAAVIALGGKTVQAAKKTLRPPGALEESKFTSVCNRCGRCIKVCPNNALQPMSITEGIECFETPHIIPREGNCCLCFSCQEVCPTGAIAKVQLEQVHMGKASLDKDRCLAWAKDKLCLVCAEQCPLGAIKFDDKNRPIIHTDKCVGCGSCEKCCAVSGEAAIRVTPL